MSTLQPPGSVPRLPDAYSTPYLVCLVKNVHWVYVFWELTEELLDKGHQELDHDPATRKVLRVWKGEAPQRSLVCDLPLEADLGGQYVYLPDPGCRYQMEIVLVGTQRSVSLLTSNFIITPFGQVCEDEDGEWASIDELYRQYQAVEGKYLSSPQLWQLSSPMRRPPQPLDKIDLIVETELVIYGKATPGAAVYVQGEAVSTNPDGSFTLRYALPEGCSIFPIKAISKDGSQKQTLVPLVIKETY